MRGFPIVSLGAITCNTTSLPSYFPYNANLVVPQYELDEYFDSNLSDLQTKYNGGYYSSSRISTITVNANNLDMKSDEQTNLNSSFGFVVDIDNEYKADYYSNKTKLQNIYSFRIDSFYCKQIYRTFFFIRINSASDILADNLYLNMPNVIEFMRGNTLFLSTKQTKGYFNIPKVTNFGDYFLDHLQNPNIELIFNISTQNLNIYECFWYSPTNISISSTSINDATVLRNLFYSKRATIGNSLQDYRGVLSVGRDDVPLSEFDIRYCDLWQNTTGKDSGLH